VIARPVPPAPRTLRLLAERIGALAVPQTDADSPIRGIEDDSRRVLPGQVFFARRGSRADGTAYARDAARRGAVAVVADGPIEAGLPVVRVADAAAALRAAADAWYGRPQDALDLLGVTGTKGKTTTTWLAAAGLRGVGRPTALLGTVLHEPAPGFAREADNTTPGPLELRRLLAEARDLGATAAALEVSSHALDQGRVEGLEFRVAVFTNLASDHMDYHGTPEAYFEAKARLFTGLEPEATAVLNREDPMWARLAARCRGRVLTYGFSPEADFRATGLRTSIDRTLFDLRASGYGEFTVETRLVGRTTR
jgi:UDP-N-acetylmuramoyl-L-alanyl-D-glutamate--2,6-diaminopimelate ligase